MHVFSWHTLKVSSSSIIISVRTLNLVFLRTLKCSLSCYSTGNSSFQFLSASAKTSLAVLPRTLKALLLFFFSSPSRFSLSPFSFGVIACTVTGDCYRARCTDRRVLPWQCYLRTSLSTRGEQIHLPTKIRLHITVPSSHDTQNTLRLSVALQAEHMHSDRAHARTHPHTHI